MTARKFENTIARLQKRKLPECPSSIEQNVLRRIRLKEELAPETLIRWIHERLFDFGWAIPTVACAALLASIASTVALAQSENSIGYAAEVLGFDLIVNVEQLAISEERLSGR